MIITSRNILLFTAIYSLSFFSMYAAQPADLESVKEQLLNAKTVAEVKSVFEQRKDLDIKSIRDIHGRSLLALSLLNGNLELMKFYRKQVLLDPLEKDNYGWNSLHFLCRYIVWKEIDCAQLLLDGLAPAQVINLVTAQTGERDTPFDLLESKYAFCAIPQVLYTFLASRLQEAQEKKAAGITEKMNLNVDLKDDLEDSLLAIPRHVREDRAVEFYRSKTVEDHKVTDVKKVQDACGESLLHTRLTSCSTQECDKPFIDFIECLPELDALYRKLTPQDIIRLCTTRNKRWATPLDEAKNDASPALCLFLQELEKAQQEQVRVWNEDKQFLYDGPRGW